MDQLYALQAANNKNSAFIKQLEIDDGKVVPNQHAVSLLAPINSKPSAQTNLNNPNKEPKKQDEQ